MEKKRTYTYRIEPYQADQTQRLTLMGLGDYLLTTASADAMLQGFGNDALGPNCGWVLLRMAVEVLRLPRQLECITVTTWVSSVNRLATTRNFEVFDEQGEMIAHASTIWTAISLDTRRTLNLLNYPDYCAAVASDMVPITTPPVRLASPEEKARYTHQVLYSYIDGNGHTYSINYLRMALDSMPLEELRTVRAVRVDVNYIRETHHGERLTIITDQAPNPSYEILSEAGEVACRLKVEWKD